MTILVHPPQIPTTPSPACSKDYREFPIHVVGAQKPFEPLRLKDRDFATIRSGAWLDDTVMDAAQRLIDYRQGSKHQSVLLRQTKFEPVDSSNHLQLMHNGKNHWVLAIFSNDHVVVADSLGLWPNKDLLRQFSELFPTAVDSFGNVSWSVLDVQRQPNASDCGVFAIANAFEILKDSDPTGRRYDVTQMRDHLIECIENNSIDTFP